MRALLGTASPGVFGARALMRGADGAQVQVQEGKRLVILLFFFITFKTRVQ